MSATLMIAFSIVHRQTCTALPHVHELALIWMARTQVFKPLALLAEVYLWLFCQILAFVDFA